MNLQVTISKPWPSFQLQKCLSVYYEFRVLFSKSVQPKAERSALTSLIIFRGILCYHGPNYAFHNLWMFIISQSICPYQAFQHSQASNLHLKRTSLGQASALHANIGQGLKGLQGKNSLAYYEHSEFTAVKGCLTRGRGASIML